MAFISIPTNQETHCNFLMGGGIPTEKIEDVYQNVNLHIVNLLLSVFLL